MLKAGFGKAILEIEDKDLPIREFKVKLSDLCTRAAYFAEGKESYMILSLDMTSLTDRDIKLFRKWINEQFGLANEQILVSATHTFAAPHLKHDLTTESDKETYEHFLKIIKDSVLKAAKTAIDDLRPASVWFGKSSCPLNVNRNIETKKGWWLGRNLAGYSDHEMRVVLIKQDNGKQNILFNYDLQPSVFDHITNDQDQRVITGDLFGIAASQLEENNCQVAIPLIGAAGDQRPLFVADNQQKFEVNKNILFKESDVLRESIDLAVKAAKKTKTSALKKLQLKAVLPSQKQQKGTFEITPTHQYHFIATDDGVAITLDALVFGDLVIIGTQPEMNSSFAKKCKAKIDCKYVLLSTLMNGGKKYLPEKSDFEKITYEAMNSPIGQNADQTMLKSFEKLNQLLKGEK